MQFARYGITAGIAVVGMVGAVGIFGRNVGRKRAKKVWHQHPHIQKSDNAAVATE
jgi:hypothetical protein